MTHGGRMTELQSFITYLAGAGVVGLVVWVWALWNSHNQHKLHVAENYIKSEDVDAIRRDLDIVKNVMFEIAGKLGVTVRVNS